MILNTTGFWVTLYGMERNHPSNLNFSPKDFSPEVERKPLLNEDQTLFLEQISNGLTLSYAGNVRGWTEETARNYQTSILKPLDARTAPHAVRRAFELGILEPNDESEPPVRVLLSKEEKDILLFASLGYVSPQVAQLKNRPVKRIHQARRGIFDKYKVDNMPHAIRVGIERGDIKLTGDPAHN